VNWSGGAPSVRGQTSRQGRHVPGSTVRLRLATRRSTYGGMFGNPMTRKSPGKSGSPGWRRTVDRYSRVDGHAYVTIKSNPVLLPPKLALLIEQRITLVGAMSTLKGIPTTYLLPGQPASRPRSVVAAQQQLIKHDLPSIPARNTAMFEAVTSLPADVVSSLLGVDRATAAKWARLAQRSWADYLAARPAPPPTS